MSSKDRLPYSEYIQTEEYKLYQREKSKKWYEINKKNKYYCGYCDKHMLHKTQYVHEQGKRHLQNVIKNNDLGDKSYHYSK